MKISKKQLVVLFLCNLVFWIVGNGLLPLLPVYAENLGADALVAGLYLAGSYVAIAAGALSASWISGSRLRHKLPLIFGSLLAVPLVYMMGRVTSLWGLSLVTVLLWYIGGLGLALSMILTGLSAGREERGKVFGILGLTSGLGAVLGGLGSGWLVKGWGFPTMFSALAIFMLLGAVAALFLEEQQAQRTQHETAPSPLGRRYFLLFSAGILVAVGGFMIFLIRSLAMHGLGFDALEISSTGVVGGLISFPAPFVMGWLSDRIDRKKVLMCGYLASTIGLILLAFANQLWHFWLVSIFVGITASASGSAGNALVTDLVSSGSIGKGLALFNATAWIGGIIGFALGGIMLQKMNLSLCCYLGGVIVIAAVGLLIPLRSSRQLLLQDPLKPAG